jgi:hypothetical protein
VSPCHLSSRWGGIGSRATLRGLLSRDSDPMSIVIQANSLSSLGRCRNVEKRRAGQFTRVDASKMRNVEGMSKADVRPGPSNTAPVSVSRCSQANQPIALHLPCLSCTPVPSTYIIIIYYNANVNVLHRASWRHKIGLINAQMVTANRNNLLLVVPSSTHHHTNHGCVRLMGVPPLLVITVHDLSYTHHCSISMPPAGAIHSRNAMKIATLPLEYST